MKNELNLHDSMLDVFGKMTQGNPGAITVLSKVLAECPEIDPQCPPFMVLVGLDAMDIHGSSVWRLYKEICGEDIVNFLALLRARQLGIIREDQIWWGGRDFPKIIEMVRERIPSFADCIKVEEGQK